MNDLPKNLRKLDRIPNRARRTLFECRAFLRALNERSDKIKAERNLPRCPEAEEHYVRAEELIRNIDELFK